jgi:hypothetical protein
MGNAVLDGVPFRLDPSSISWDFTIGVSETKTIGGRVVQVFGAKVGDLQLEGSFGRGGWQEQARFLDRMKALGESQLDHWPSTNRDALRFVWPQRGWDFRVWLRSFSEAGGASVEMSVENFNPKWSLTLFIVDDNAALKTVSEDAYINRLMAGIGWRQTAFNGPMGNVELQAAISSIGATTIREYLSVGYGLASPFASQGTTGSPTAGTIVPTGDIQKYAQDKAATRGWTGAEWDALYEIVRRESSWSPTADNPTSTAYGLFQFLDSTWASVGGVRTSDPYQQIDLGLEYIARRYGTPSAALAFHNAHHWY